MAVQTQDKSLSQTWPHPKIWSRQRRMKAVLCLRRHMHKTHRKKFQTKCLFKWIDCIRALSECEVRFERAQLEWRNKKGRQIWQQRILRVQWAREHARRSNLDYPRRRLWPLNLLQMVSLTRKMTQTKNKAQAAILSLKMKCSHLKSLTTSVLSARMKCFQTITRRRICSTSSSFTIRGSTSWKIYRLKGIILRRERSLWYLLRPYSRKNLALTTWRRLKSTSTTKRLGWKRHQLVLVDLNTTATPTIEA